ncbi:glycosyltransferase, partial [Flavobacteriaceae bacterium]|nr:glycosyltransferase [Flavobacteriaceae bacterium]
AQKQVFIIDIIGILTKIYSYADIAYIGGGMGKNGLHNTLEAAVFGIPIIIGKNYSNFPEAVEMYKNGGLMSVRTAESFNDILDKLLKNKKLLAKCGEKNKNFIIKNKGATSIILNKLSYLY